MSSLQQKYLRHAKKQESITHTQRTVIIKIVPKRERNYKREANTKRGDTCIHTIDSLRCTVETINNTTF